MRLAGPGELVAWPTRSSCMRIFCEHAASASVLCDRSWALLSKGTELPHRLQRLDAVCSALHLQRFPGRTGPLLAQTRILRLATNRRVACCPVISQMNKAASPRMAAVSKVTASQHTSSSSLGNCTTHGGPWNDARGSINLAIRTNPLTAFVCKTIHDSVA